MRTDQHGAPILHIGVVNLLEALGLAGDMTVYGKRENVLVIRQNGNERTMARINMNNRDVINSPYFNLKQNDIVYVVSGQKDEAVASDFHATLTKLFASDKLQDGIVFLRPVNNLIQIQDVVAKGEEMGLTMEEMKNTHSCNTNPPCGTCRKCIQRKEAGLDD
jgi:hypothetical protein